MPTGRDQKSERIFQPRGGFSRRLAAQLGRRPNPVLLRYTSTCIRAIAAHRISAAQAPARPGRSPGGLQSRISGIRLRAPVIMGAEARLWKQASLHAEESAGVGTVRAPHARCSVRTMDREMPIKCGCECRRSESTMEAAALVRASSSAGGRCCRNTCSIGWPNVAPD